MRDDRSDELARHGPLLSIVVGYLLFLFGVAYWAERTRRLEGRASRCSPTS